MLLMKHTRKSPYSIIGMIRKLLFGLGLETVVIRTELRIAEALGNFPLNGEL